MYFLMCALPTPNGEFHLGHIAGPYLKMDIINRYCRQTGIETAFYGGVDFLDSFTLLAAQKNNCSRTEQSRKFHQRLMQNLERMNIQMDAFINPAEGAHKDLYINCINRFLGPTIQAHGVLKSEMYPCDEQGFLPPSFIQGECAACHSKMQGLICEGCSMTWAPEQILNKRYPFSTNVSEQNTESAFFQVPSDALIKWIAEQNLPESIQAKLNDMLLNTDHIRLTSPVQREAVEADYASQNQIHVLAYAYALGELAKENHGLAFNPFDAQSDSTNAVSFGIDNLAYYFFELPAQVLAADEVKGMDLHLTNHFMNLDDQKFSTSRNHAIWVSKLPDYVDSDLLRLYLVINAADEAASNFSSEDFVRVHDGLAASMNQLIISSSSRATTRDPAIRNANSKAQCAFGYRDQVAVRRSKNKQSDPRTSFLLPENYSAKKIAEYHQQWIDTLKKQPELLKDYAHCMSPVMPNLLHRIEQQKAFELIGDRPIQALENASEEIHQFDL